ncbi:MAG TPA: hypothetical protein PLF40_32900 [Kofleriaceae bacterium]|nr:hypothetical protein [Kofleriaceae bacterium]
MLGLCRNKSVNLLPDKELATLLRQSEDQLQYTNINALGRAIGQGPLWNDQWLYAYKHGLHLPFGIAACADHRWLAYRDFLELVFVNIEPDMKWLGRAKLHQHRRRALRPCIFASAGIDLQHFHSGGRAHDMTVQFYAGLHDLCFGLPRLSLRHRQLRLRICHRIAPRDHFLL